MWAIAARIPFGSAPASRAAPPLSANAERVVSKHARIVARNRSFFVAYSWNRYGCETPTRRAIACVEVPA